jgi:hypothetical protein
MIACPEVANVVAMPLTNASNAIGSGRAFFFLGGISPAWTRSCTLTHVAKFALSSGSNGNAVKSRLASFVISSWQSAQCFSMNGFASGNSEAPCNRRLEDATSKPASVTLTSKKFSCPVAGATRDLPCPMDLATGRATGPTSEDASGSGVGMTLF